MNPLYQLASTAESEGASSGLFASLGIDWTMLVLQTVAFVALLWLLSKYVFPVLIKTLDDRDARIAEGQRAAVEASQAAERAEKASEKHIAQAKKDAAAIVETATKEAARIADEAEARATKKADHVLEQAEARIASDIADAKKSLHSEMVSLVSAATEKVTAQKLDASSDAALIRKALEER